MDGEARRLIKELAARMRRTGSPTAQIAAELMRRFGLNPRVACRHALGLSQAEIADRYNRRWPAPVPKTAKHVSYWERWRGPGTTGSSSARTPSLEDLGRLATLYGCLVDDLLYGPRRVPTPYEVTVPYEVITDVLDGLRHPAEAQATYPENYENDAVVALRTPIGEWSITVTMSRRRFSALLATGGLAALLPDAALASAATETTTVTASFRRTLLAHQSGHHLLTPAAHIAALTDTLRDIAASRESADASLRRDLRGLQAEIAEHLSWLHREVADLDGCRRWAANATSWALEAGDTTMATYMMMRTASLALDHGDYPRAIELAQAAQHTTWQIPAALQGVARLYHARGTAQTGSIDAAALDTADELLATSPSPSVPAYLRFYGPRFAELQRATCYLSTGQPGRAVTILQAQLTGLPPDYHRDRAVHLARLGGAHAADRAPDAAAIAGLASLTEARQAGSQHVVAELAPLRDRLTRHWPAQPKVREFGEALAAFPTA
ncbi:hypothetical protein ACFHYQ_07970 [Sphaerimonospora cavernae]|uniref:HTH cro/C1-type domain-containing protein n=1 Tax=Sphaerimonospora cavernae TaxID=1740611 RepID=A0ABV6U1F0_9ACTN